MAFMMPVMKNEFDIYKGSGRSRKESDCSNASSCRSRKVSETRSECPSLSTSPSANDYGVQHRNYINRNNSCAFSQKTAVRQNRHQADVEKSLTFDRRLIKGRPAFISSVLRDKEKRNKFKYAETVEKTKLFVKNVSFETTKTELELLFGEFGTVKDVRLVCHNSHQQLHSLDDAATSLDPERMTPFKFTSTHSSAAFQDGLLVCVKQKHMPGNEIQNNVHIMKFGLNNQTKRLYQTFPGPLTPVTHTKQIIDFCLERIRNGPIGLGVNSRSTSNSMSSLQSIDQSNRASFSLLWNFLILLIRQRGATMSKYLLE